MFYLQCKIYNDGGHFIALPHTTRSGLRKRPKPPDELKLGLVGQLNRCVCLSAAERGRGSPQKRERSERFCGVAASPLSYQRQAHAPVPKNVFTIRLKNLFRMFRLL